MKPSHVRLEFLHYLCTETFQSCTCTRFPFPIDAGTNVARNVKAPFLQAAPRPAAVERKQNRSKDPA